MLALTPDCILIHGGRHFKSISSKNINDSFFLCSLGKKPGEESWAQLLVQPSIPRFAHTICLVNNKIFIIGGFSNEDDKEASKIEKLSLVEDMPEKNKTIETGIIISIVDITKVTDLKAATIEMHQAAVQTHGKV